MQSRNPTAMTGAKTWQSLRESSRILAVAILGVVLFAWLAYMVSSGRAGALDTFARGMVHGWSNPLLTRIMFVATFLGRTGFIAVVGAFFVWWLIKTGRRQEALLLASGSVGAYLFMQILKLAFHRPRPDPFFGLQPPESYSFPSGHALLSTVFYVLLATLVTRNPVIRAAAVALAGLIGLSRIYLGVHYPTDVFAGYAAALVCLSALTAAANAKVRFRIRRMIEVSLGTGNKA